MEGVQVGGEDAGGLERHFDWDLFFYRVQAGGESVFKGLLEVSEWDVLTWRCLKASWVDAVRGTRGHVFLSKRA